MRTILSSRTDHYLARVSIFLIIVALIAGMVGCAEHPFGEDLEIRTWHDLDKVRKKENLDNHHTLKNNLDQTTEGYEQVVGKEAGVKGWEPIGTSIIPFSGNFDGRGHTIMGLVIHRPSESNVGLFRSVAEEGVIENVRVVDVDVIGHYGVGALVGENSGTVSNSYSSGNVTGDDGVGSLVGSNEGNVKDSHSTSNVTGDDGVGSLVGDNTGTVSHSYSTGSVSGDKYVGGLVGDNTGTVSNNSSFRGNVTSEKGSYIGGLVGRNYEGTVSDSDSAGSLSGESYVGGLVGGNEKGTVSNSYSTGSVSGESYVGGLVGANEKGTVSNSYSTGSVSGESYVGGLVGSSYEESAVSDSYSKGSVTGHAGVGGLVGVNNKSTVNNSHYNYDEVLVNGEKIITIGALFDKDFQEWLDNDKSLDVNERLSKEGGYYVVNNVTDFKELLALGQNTSLEFKLTNDLDLATEPNFYIPYFAGQFDGNGHKISNLSLNLTFASNIGLFGYLAGDREITGVGVENVKITGASFVGGLVGANWEGTVINSYSTGSVNGTEDVGGLVGCNYGESTVKDSYSASNVFGDKHVGGLVGDNKDTVRRCHFTGNVTSEGSHTGGLVGSNSGPVSESYSTGNVAGKDRVGGLVGFNKWAYVEVCYSNCSVEGDYDVGGLVGYNEGGTVSNSYSTSNVTGKDRVGGLVGQNKYIDTIKEGKVNSSYSRGSVSGKKNVGGLVGQNVGGSVTRSFWDTETSGQADSDGGTPRNTTEMKSITTFMPASWGIRAVSLRSERNPGYTWNIVNGWDYPFLSWEP